jgi:hypothetical protein
MLLAPYVSCLRHSFTPHAKPIAPAPHKLPPLLGDWFSQPEVINRRDHARSVDTIAKEGCGTGNLLSVLLTA